MKKFMSLCLALLLMLSLGVTAFAANTTLTPEAGNGKETNADASAVIADSAVGEVVIPKDYIKNTADIGGADTTLAAVKPAETLSFEANLITATSPAGAAHQTLTCEVQKDADGVVTGVKVTIPANFNAPGKYNYKITETAPSPASQGVTYDNAGVYLQVFVYYDETGALQKQVTFTQASDTDQPQANALKKGAFRNMYKLDGDGGELPAPNPDPGTNPDPKPDPQINPNPGHNPDPEEHDKKPDPATYGPLSVKKTVAGKMGDKAHGSFTIYVTLYSELPVRNDITYGREQIIAKVDDNTITETNESALPADGKWYKNSGVNIGNPNAYMVKVTFTLGNDELVRFNNIPAGVTYKVQEDGQHIGKLTETNVNTANAGYTVSYFNGKLEGNTSNPSPATPGDYGKASCVTGTIGGDTRNNIRIENRKGDNTEDSEIVTPNTGVVLESLPYVIILALVVIATAVIIVKKTKKVED